MGSEMCIRDRPRTTPRPWPCWLTLHACYAPAGLCGVCTTTTCRGRLMYGALLGRPAKSYGIVDTPSSEQCVDKPTTSSPHRAKGRDLDHTRPNAPTVVS